MMQEELEILTTEVLDFIRGESLQHKYTEHTGELQLKNCPSCGDGKYHFYWSIHKPGAPYWCHKCGAKGNYYSLRKSMNPREQAKKYEVTSLGGALKGILRREDSQPKKTYDPSWIEDKHLSLLKNEHGALQELHNRGITTDTIKHFKIGVTNSYNDKPCPPAWVFPSFLQDGQIGLVKYRTVPPQEKKMWREAEMESILFGLSGLDHGLNQVVVCEGEIDCLSLWQSGHKNVISVPAGAKSLRPEWVDAISSFEKIILAYDHDKAGIEGRNELRRRLGEEKTYIAELPEGFDCNDVLVRFGELHLREAIDDCILPPVEGASSIAQEMLELQRELALGEDEQQQKLEWMFPRLQEVIGSVPPSCLVVVTGKMGTGKTTLLKQQFLEWAKEGKPVMIWCGEMTPRQLVKQLIQSITLCEEQEITEERIAEAYEVAKDLPLYFGNLGLTPTIDAVLDLATNCYKRYGCKTICIDNLLTLAVGRDPQQQQREIAVACKNWTQHYGGNIFLVAHPRKEGSDTVETRESVAGSYDVMNLSDIAFTVFRKDLSPKTAHELETMDGDQMTLSRKTTVLCLKNRYNPGKGHCWLFNEGEYSRFRECTADDFQREL